MFKGLIKQQLKKKVILNAANLKYLGKTLTNQNFSFQDIKGKIKYRERLLPFGAGNFVFPF